MEQFPNEGDDIQVIHLWGWYTAQMIGLYLYIFFSVQVYFHLVYLQVVQRYFFSGEIQICCWAATCLPGWMGQTYSPLHWTSSRRSGHHNANDCDADDHDMTFMIVMLIMILILSQAYSSLHWASTRRLGHHGVLVLIIVLICWC